jgi:hypothetical protein
MMATPLGDLYSLEFLLLIISAVIWFRVGLVEESGSPWLFAGASVVTYVITWRGLHWGVIGCVIGQVLLALVIAAWRAWRAIEDQRRG